MVRHRARFGPVLLPSDKSNGASPQRRLKALIVDPDDMRQLSLRARLRETFLFRPTLSARSKSEAERLLKTPDGSGIDVTFLHWKVAERLESRESSNALLSAAPIIVLFEPAASEEVQARLLGAIGAAGALTLPVVPDALTDLLHKVVQGD